MALPPPVNLREKLPAILGRINPIINEISSQQSAISNLEAEVETLNEATEGPDLTLLFENGLI